MLIAHPPAIKEYVTAYWIAIGGHGDPPSIEKALVVGKLDTDALVTVFKAYKSDPNPSSDSIDCKEVFKILKLKKIPIFGLLACVQKNFRKNGFLTPTWENVLKDELKRIGVPV